MKILLTIFVCICIKVKPLQKWIWIVRTFHSIYMLKEKKIILFVLKEFRRCHPKYASLYIDYFELEDPGKTVNAGTGFPWTPTAGCINTDPPKLTYLASVPPQYFPQPRKIDYHPRRGNEKSTLHPDKFCLIPPT